MPALKKLRGFTLIELMVAVSIVAILSAVGITSYSQSQKLARDSKRKQDLRSIGIALSLFYGSQTPRSYPVSADWDYSTDTTQPWIPGLDQNFINRVPTDPTNTGTMPWTTNGGFTYAYCANSTNCHSDCTTLTSPWYILVTRLENTSDKETIQNQDIRWCDGSLLRDKSGWDADNRIFAITPD